MRYKFLFHYFFSAIYYCGENLDLGDEILVGNYGQGDAID
jgi:hypothetical protein